MTKKETGVVQIRGRDYKTVALRVAEFREKHSIDEGWAILTDIFECSPEQVIVRSQIAHPDGRVVATGEAQEVWEGQINKTSALENCSTSAIGRALAAAGWAGSEFCSADELQQALDKQRDGGTNRPKAPASERDARPADEPFPVERTIESIGKFRSAERILGAGRYAVKHYNAEDQALVAQAMLDRAAKLHQSLTAEDKGSIDEWANGILARNKATADTEEQAKETF